MTSRREGVRFMSVSQPHAGDFLNAVPSRACFRVETWAMRIAVQRRFGLPVDAALAANVGRNHRGQVLDAMGDTAQNVARFGHTFRHKQLLERLVRCLRDAWGAIVEMEPSSHLPYSNNYKPDVVIKGQGRGGARYVGDLKLVDPLSSDPARVGLRGALVGFGNTEPPMRAKVLGLKQRGHKDDGNFRPSDGGGYVAPQTADYSHAIAQKCDVQVLLFETFGGMSAPVRELMGRAADAVHNKLSRAQYLDEVSWSTRCWTALQYQRLSVALHTACAFEIAYEIGDRSAGLGDVVAGAC